MCPAQSRRCPVCCELEHPPSLLEIRPSVLQLFWLCSEIELLLGLGFRDPKVLESLPAEQHAASDCGRGPPARLGESKGFPKHWSWSFRSIRWVQGIVVLASELCTHGCELLWLAICLSCYAGKPQQATVGDYSEHLRANGSTRCAKCQNACMFVLLATESCT